MKNSNFFGNGASIAGAIGAAFRACTFVDDGIYAEGMLMNNFCELEKPDDWIFVGLIERGDQVVLGGPPKAGKSLMVSQIALAAASGGSFMKWKAAKPCKVAYVNLEIRSKRFAGRLAYQSGTTPDEIRKTRKVPKIIAEINRHNRLMPIHDYRTIDVMEEGNAEVAALRKKIADYAPDLVIWDVLARCHNEDENTAAMKKVMVKLRELSGAAASIIVHHARKPAEDNNRPLQAVDLRGHGSIHGEPDLTMVLTKLSGQGARYVLTWTARNVEEPKETPLNCRSLCFVDAAEEKASAQVEAIKTAFIGRTMMQSSELLDAIKDALRCGRDVAYATIATAVESKLLQKLRDGNAVVYKLAA